MLWLFQNDVQLNIIFQLYSRNGTSGRAYEIPEHQL